MYYIKVTEDQNELYLRIEHLYVHKTTQFQEFVIGEFNVGGENVKSLMIDNRVQTSDVDFELYHRDLVLQTDGKSKKALVIGAGEGVSTNLLVKQGYEVTAIDIDLQLISAAREFLFDWNEDIYSRTNEFRLVIADALKYIKEVKDEEYDYVVFDLTEPTTSSEKAYSTEFMEEIKRILKTGGVLSFQDGDPAFSSILQPIVLEAFNTQITVNEKDVNILNNRDWRFGHIIKEGK